MVGMRGPLAEGEEERARRFGKDIVGIIVKCSTMSLFQSHLMMCGPSSSPGTWSTLVSKQQDQAGQDESRGHQELGLITIVLGDEPSQQRTEYGRHSLDGVVHPERLGAEVSEGHPGDHGVAGNADPSPA